MSMFETGIRPAIDKLMLDKAKERRDYGGYWSASSAGYCMRKVIFDRLQVPFTKEDARKQRVFESGHIFHEWIQRATKEAGLSIAQELELQDDSLMIRGHIDDLIMVPTGRIVIGGEKVDVEDIKPGQIFPLKKSEEAYRETHLILYDYKTVNSRAFTWAKKNGDAISHYHKMQLGTYMYMIRNDATLQEFPDETADSILNCTLLEEARILKVSKDDLRMSEQQLMWTPEIKEEVVQYWTTLNDYWKSHKLPKCTCADHEGGFMAREAYNDYFYDGEPCSIKWFLQCIKEKKIDAGNWTAEEV